MQYKYIFIKDFKTNIGVIPKGTEITLFRDFVYMNGGMVHPSYNDLFMHIINTPELKSEYLQEEKLIHNKV